MPPQFLDGADVDALLEVIGELDTPPALIVVDTLARCMVGGDGNAAKGMGLTRPRRAHGPRTRGDGPSLPPRHRAEQS